MTHYYVYRGVKYTKDGDQHTTVKHDRLDLFDKVYRGIKYLNLPRFKHVTCDHVYRGAHYMA